MSHWLSLPLLLLVATPSSGIAERPSGNGKKVYANPNKNASIARAVETGGFIYVSGQVPIDAKGRVVDGGIEAQADQAFRNVIDVLKVTGLDASHVVKINVYLSDINDFDRMDKIFAQHFRAGTAARTTVQVAKLWKNVRIEVDAIAAR